jgi:hypothetical protein
MGKDFHFFTIYALARSAGLKPDHAHTTDYASQHKDDAKYEHALFTAPLFCTKRCVKTA